MRPAYPVLDVLLFVAILAVVALLAAVWLPLVLLTVVGGLSLWLIRT